MADAPPKPNFFILGAPKCGTTSLYEYLAPHPAVFMSAVKEPHYFGTDLGFHVGEHRTEAEYRSLFAGAEGYARVGEASVLYLFSRDAGRQIREFCGDDVRAIAMTRHPVQMLYSLHAQVLRSGAERDIDFNRVMAEHLDRADRGAQRSYEEAFPYLDVATLSPQIERAFDVFGRDRVMVVDLADLARDPVAVVGGVFRFLGIDDTFRPGFDVHNEKRRPLTPGVASFFKEHERLRRFLLRTVPPPVYRPMLSLIGRFRQVERPPMSDDTRARLLAYFEAEMARLDALLERSPARVGTNDPSS